jgi:corrinoid protein of di/trimethylamine methyltransferase
MQEKLLKAIVEMREDEALALAKEALDAGADPLEMVDLFRKAVEKVGDLYEKGEYFLPELMMTGEMMKQLAELTKDKISAESSSSGKKLGRVLIGTVKGDIHDIGKNIVTFMLDANGFEVKDLGVDISAEKFIEAINEFNPQIVGLSALLTLAFDPMKEIVEAFEKAGLRDKVKVMVGGAPVNEQICKYAGADGWGKDAVEAVSLAKKWVGGA